MLTHNNIAACRISPPDTNAQITVEVIFHSHPDDTLLQTVKKYFAAETNRQIKPCTPKKIYTAAGEKIQVDFIVSLTTLH